VIPGQMPWIGGIVISLLAADADFMTACDSRLAGATPSNVTQPYVTVQTVTNGGLDDAGRAQLPIVQITAWCKPGDNDEQDPRLTVWDIAAAAQRVLLGTSRKNESYQNVFYNIERLVEGPLDRTDITRGPSEPLYGAMIRVELKVRLDN
jgi:hypothetical protein